jgi:hypothetical protein
MLRACANSSLRRSGDPEPGRQARRLAAEIAATPTLDEVLAQLIAVSADSDQ